MSTMPFGIRRAPRIYSERTPRGPRLIVPDAATIRALEDSVDRKHFEARKKSSSLVQMAERSMKAARLFDWGRDGFNTKSIGWTTDTQKGLLLDTTTAGTWLKLITAGGVTNTAPATYNSTGHGFSNGDVTVAENIGGNLSTNQTGLATAVAANTLQLTTLEGQPVNGSAAYTAGGFLLNLTQAKFVQDILGTREGTDATIAGTSSSKGIGTGSTITWLAVPPGNPAYVVLYDAAGGSDATNRLVAWQDGRVRVITVGDTPGGSISIKCQPIRAQLWDGATGAAPVLWFSNGFSATLNAAAAQGADSLTVLATGHDIPDLQTAEGIDFGGGIPVTPGGGSITLPPGSIYAPLTPTGFYEL